MAAPVVSGAAADILQAHPSLTPDQVKARLMLTGYKAFPSTSSVTDPTSGAVYTDQYDIFTIGAGYLDIQAALNDTNIATGTALSPTVSFDPSSGNVYLSTDPSAVWNSHAVWGTQSVWGPSVVDATHAVWGTSTAQGFPPIWGTHAVWGTSTNDATETTTILVLGEK